MSPEELNKHSNRPHCLYLWFLHGSPVCSEQIRERDCPYKFWTCPVKEKNGELIEPVTELITGQEQEKLPLSS